MASRALSTALLGAGCTLAGTVLGWQLRGPVAPPAEPPSPPAWQAPVYGLELLPEVLAVELLGPWAPRPAPLPGGSGLLGELGALRDWHEGFRALDARVERPAPLGPALAEAFLSAPELFLSEYPSRFDVPALDLYGPRPAPPPQKKGQPMAASPSGSEAAPSAARRRLLALCAGLTLSGCAAVQVRQVYEDFVRDCPEDTQGTLRHLGLEPDRIYMMELAREQLRSIEDIYILREGPVEGVFARFGAAPDMTRKARLYGEVKLYGDRFAVLFHKMKLQDGAVLPICAVASHQTATDPGLGQWPWAHEFNLRPEHMEKLPAVRAGLRRGELPIAMVDISIAFNSVPGYWLTE